MTYNGFTYQSEGMTGHRGVFVYYEIYLDVVFVTNLFMDYVLLRLVGGFLDCRSSRMRSLAGAAIGALMACLLLFLPTDSFFPSSILLQGLTVVLMAKVGCQVKTGSMLVKAIVALYLTAFLCGGFWEAISDGSEMDLKTFLLFTACSYLLFTCISIGYDYVQIKRKHIYPVRLGYDGKYTDLYGLYDTGNVLTDMASAKPVSIIGKEVLEELLSEETWDRLRHFQEKSGELEYTALSKMQPHFLPYRTIGNEGMLLAVTLEDLCIHTPREVVHIPNPMVAISLNPSALGAEYQMILNSKLLYRKI